ncbi:MAG TPA: UbiA family prenyltransferase [Chitinivibrionales bacterium]|nr:UbiA family prenyltransferase [Chitinivibrionales bacterium]
MRLYYSFVTGMAGWLGVSYYEYLSTNPIERTIETAPAPEKKIIILVLLFLSWGVNQIINDFLGLKEDRINAPHRPMVTGELNPYGALLLSIALILVSAAVTWFYLEPFAIVFLFAGVLLNILYEFAKGKGILGNIVFGFMITMAPLFGGYASGPTASTVLMPHRVSVLIMVWVMNALMTYYTYFKDYKGDMAAGKLTLVVSFGLRKSRWISIFSAFLPTLIFAALRISGIYRTPLNTTFISLGLLTVFLQIWTGVLYYRFPSGPGAYNSLITNFRACTCGQAALIGIFNPDLALWLFIFSYVFVGFLFDFHRDHQQ